ncbi:sugar ABC transporter permease [Nonomuraea sp. NPDC026600]|uniref:carbohydrate ABC transporter permease n=1 Tax=Nonomuraea sp. NPDC026600 TaxID=3155363 RepID=UPI0034071C8C
MSVVATHARGRSGPWRPAAGHVFVSGYVVLLIAFGVAPTVYALYLAFTDGDGRFAGVANFIRTAQDYRFLSAVGHVATYLVLWLVTLTVLVLVLALVVHRLTSRWSRAALRFVYYVPGALAGASSVLLWLFMLDPSVSPVNGLVRSLWGDTLVHVIAPGHLPWIFTVIAFWTGAGGWIVVMYGALNSIPNTVIEAAKVDGAGPVKTAWRVQLPMLRKWIVYMLILSLAAGTQLFVEPQLVSQASFGVVGTDYSLNQLAYLYAFDQNDFNGSAAIAMDLLIVALCCAGLFVAKGGLFDAD